ncbi:hypothetical protein OGATHE_002997 [Ogataea polymorpha]|uniref:Uncharacterized protein n=1 Tax=Ogataea polymorpha TaxID=460523 RepID=A0A9P8PFB6_9ASCO|nr:hypothetical protein OGATHE_002997 [Ogataea polymorpha]
MRGKYFWLNLLMVKQNTVEVAVNTVVHVDSFLEGVGALGRDVYSEREARSGQKAAQFGEDVKIWELLCRKVGVQRRPENGRRRVERGFRKAASNVEHLQAVAQRRGVVKDHPRVPDGRLDSVEIFAT